jgi:hypothetical protein
MNDDLLVFVTMYGAALIVLLALVLGGPPVWSLM